MSSMPPAPAEMSRQGVESAGGWAAFVDESESDRSRDPDTYILTAAVVAVDSFEEVRGEMLELRIGKGGKVHWRDEDARRQMSIITTVSKLPIEQVVIVRSGVPEERGERRRRLCLRQLCYELDQMGVDRMTLESRGPADDARDLRALQTFRSSKTVGSRLRSTTSRDLPSRYCGCPTPSAAP